jgi:signal transduction histidine kinase/ActR/RegA family two-component response regulator
MSEARKLQHRVASAFNEPAPPSAEGRIGDGDVGRNSAAEVAAALPPTPSVAQPERAVAEKENLVPYVLIAGGLLVLMLALSIHLDASYVIFTVCLGAGAIASGLYGYAQKLESVAPGKLNDDFPLIDPGRADWYLRKEPLRGNGVPVESLHDALGDIILTRRLDGVILSANRVFREMTGRARPEGRTCEELRIRFRPGSTEHCYEVEFQTPTGTRVYFWNDVVMRDPASGGVMIQSIARDVTIERQETARQEQARIRAEQESDRKSRLIATVSHEIRTPLSGLLGMGHLLAGTELSPEQNNYLDGIRQSGAALVQLVEDLLDFSTISVGRFQLHPKVEPIRPMIENTVEMLSSRAHAKGIEIGSTMAADLPEMLTFDPGRFRQVLYNVIGNAVKFTESGGVLVTVGLDADMLTIRVRDSGPGMNEAEMQRIFGEFEQGNLSRLREGGVGLGLAISARIMAAMGGGLSVESSLGEGSTFLIRLPVEDAERPMRSGHELAGARILLFAPRGPAAMALSQTVIGFGADIVLAADMSEAEQAIGERGPFSAVIIDHRLDTDFAERLSRDPGLAGAKRIFLVNPESRPARMSGTNYDSWLIRPLREQSLLDVLTGKLRGLEPRVATAENFPVLPVEPLEYHRPPAPAEATRTSHGTGPGQGLSILVGEDDPVNAMISQALLERSGHRVTLTETFSALAAELSQNDVDIILTDYSMPDGTCERFIEETRGREKRKGLKRMPVIVLTGDGTDITRRSLLAAGADLVLVKPAGPKILNGAIEHLANERARSS